MQNLTTPSNTPPPKKKISKKLVTFTVYGINQLDNIYILQILFSDPNDYCMSDKTWKIFQKA